MDLPDIYRKLHPTTVYCSSAHGTFCRIDHMLGHSISLKFKKIETMQSIFSDHNGLKLEMNSRRKTVKPTNIWKLNNILLTSGSKKSPGKLENTMREMK